MHRIALFTLILTFSFTLKAQVLLGGEHFSPNESTIAINPSNPNEMVAASNIRNFYHSLDGGSSWETLVATSELGIYGDPVLHYSGSTLYFAHLSKTPNLGYGDWFDRIVVQKIDSITPWLETSYSVGYNEGKMQDKPWLSSDDSHFSPYQGRVYVTWTEFDEYGSEDEEDHSRIRFSYYDPLNDNFSEAITISDTVGNCLDSDETLEGAVTASSPRGKLYAVWAGHDNIYFDWSDNGGTSWNKDLIIGKQVNGWNMDMPHVMRANGMPFICVGSDGIIYVVWADERSGNADIWLKYSLDEGLSWSDAVLINPEMKGHQYFPNMTYNSTKNQVDIIYNDFHGSINEVFFTVKVSSFKLDNGSHVISHKEVCGPSPLPGDRVFFGDYQDIDHVGGITYYSTTLYQGRQLEILIGSIESAYSPTINTVVEVADGDSLHFILAKPSLTSFKGKLRVTQDGKTTTYKFSQENISKPSDYQYVSECLLLSTPINPQLGYTYEISGWYRCSDLRRKSRFKASVK